jgi:GNAT superfamily N-acetyltransferase
MQARTREVKTLLVDLAERGKGYATSLMHKLCREADADNMILVLMPQGFADAAWTDEQLAGWYEQFGFQVIQTEPAVLMARPPGSTPRLLALSPVAASMYAERFGKAHQ